MSEQFYDRPRRFGRIPHATARSGLQRGALYRLAARHKGLFKKAGAATIVDLELLDAVLAALPPADVNEPARAQHNTPKSAA
jgi:hypothetical protein